VTPTEPELRDASLRRWRRRLADERAEAELYRSLASRREGEDREILLAIAQAEARHAAHWESLLGDDVGTPRRGSLRTRLLVALARRFGSVFVLALVQQAESRTPYDADADATATMAADERVHEEIVRGLAARGRARVSGTFRAAVFGANDGLVSNLALVLGVAAGGVAESTVLLTGVAGLLAGALSMGAGEWISVRSQRELITASAPGSGTQALIAHLDVDANELAFVYRARGMSAEDAERRADAVLARQEPAHDADASTDALDAVGSDVGAAMSSFAFFASGAAVPVLPFAVGLTGGPAVLVAAALVGVALLLTGAVVGVLSGGPPLARAVRQLVLGLGAAGITYLVGSLVGATVA
jgi:VIT1/CCC1 family predicted Fe2+/Mn2+ transporter